MSDSREVAQANPRIRVPVSGVLEIELTPELRMSLQEVTVRPGAAPAAPARPPAKRVTEPQLKRLFAIVGRCGWSASDLRQYIKAAFGIDSTRNLTMQEYDALIRVIETSTPPMALAEVQRRHP